MKTKKEKPKKYAINIDKWGHISHRFGLEKCILHGYPSLSSVVEHLTVDVSKYQMVTGSNPVVGRLLY
jgi:hypothetical protein